MNSDAPSLGVPITDGNRRRDAVHVAAAPVTAGERLTPGPVNPCHPSVDAAHSIPQVRPMRCPNVLTLTAVISLFGGMAHAEAFRVLPYVQNPSTDAITVRWMSNDNVTGMLVVETPEGRREFPSRPVRADALAYNPFVPEPGGPHPALPYLHSVRVSGLRPGTRYAYTVKQGEQSHTDEFRTAPSAEQPVRFIVYSDPETEPESSTSPPVDWPASSRSNRPAGLTQYVADQTTGYRENLKVIASRRPDFLAIPGDLVETGGEQRDWDEFWRHVAGDYGKLAGRTPIIAALGNHENFAGPGGGYTAQGANFATAKFLTYFESPSNEAANPRHRGRYFRIDFGPLALITLDSSDGLPHQTASDTNFNLEGSFAPNFNPGSEQHRWLEQQLADAQKKCRFTFVQFHHTAYGSGPHSVPFGRPTFSGQSGIAMRVLQPLLFRYGVDAVFSGHDEMLERSLVTGHEVLPDGTTRPHEIHFYDVGIGGDGLRGPSLDYDNPFRKFLAHENEPEVWDGKRLVSGGKHYGHVEVNVDRDAQGRWQAEIVPVHVFPRHDAEGRVTGWERRPCNDVVRLSAREIPAIPDDRTSALGLALLATLAGLPLLYRALRVASPMRMRGTRATALKCVRA